MSQPYVGSLIAVTVVAALGVLMLGFPVRSSLLQWGIIDRPNERSSHSKPTARGGGITILIVLLLVEGTVEIQRNNNVAITFLVVAVFLAAISFVDDLWSVSATIRFAAHGLAAMSVLGTLGWPQICIGLGPNAEIALPRLVGLWLAALWIAGYTNAFNFMDGINGIACGQAAITGAGMALLTGLALGDFSRAPVVLGFVIAGATLGFLPHNFPRARMFMGDVGSAPLGFLLSALALWQAKAAGWWLLIPLVLLHANFVLDTGITLVRRMFRGEQWYCAHREHFYQRLVRAGKSHAFVTSCEMALQGITLLLMIIYLRVNPALRLGLANVVILTWLIFFSYCERSFVSVESRILPNSRR